MTRKLQSVIIFTPPSSR